MLRAVAGSLLLATHLLTCTGWLPLLVAALAWWDGQHHVALHARPGLVAVVLAHGGGATAGRDRHVHHEHSAVSNVLTSLADHRHAEQDHVLGFRAASDLRPQRDLIVELPAPALLVSAGLVLKPVSVFSCAPWRGGAVGGLRADPLGPALRTVSLLV